MQAADCSISACSIDDVPVRFPFRLEGNQPRNCGYPGFDLSCNNPRTTVLKLPHSGDFLVRDIDYCTQQIQLYDSDNCLPKRLLQLNLSGKSSSSRQVGILFLSIGIPVLVCASGMAMSAYLMMWHPRRNAVYNTQRNTATATVSPQPTILVMGLEESTIESFDKLVLGESKRLPGPMVAPVLYAYRNITAKKH
ncbi:hypothetical protein NC653_032936 [Populus alba x Populus x berolinensis]|uniref:RING-type E3 ubiquitin transferase n=1 Tax=Populus alba x Populus x berolinensis TaxID=444605 RepID=A0AAD6LVE7_9ROSI|nr:hypothetical protein NC653_032936 [Populus alba x Populus x berolinensis]